MPRIPRLVSAPALFVMALSASSNDDMADVCLDDGDCLQEGGLSLLQVGARQFSSNTQTSSTGTGTQGVSLNSQRNAPEDARPQTVWDCCGSHVSEESVRNLYFFCEGPLVRPTPETHSYTSVGIAPIATLMCGTSLDALSHPMQYMLLKLPDALNYCEEDKMSLSLMVTLPIRMTDDEFFSSEVWYNTPMVPECSFQKLSLLQTNVFRDSGMTNPGMAISRMKSLLQASPSALLPPSPGYQMLTEDHERTLTFFCEGPVVLSTTETLTHESFGPAPLGRFMCGTSMSSMTHPMAYLFVHLPGGFDCEVGTMAIKAMVNLPAHTTDDEFFNSKYWRHMAMIPRCSFYDFTQDMVSFSTDSVFNPGIGVA